MPPKGSRAVRGGRITGAGRGRGAANIPSITHDAVESQSQSQSQQSSDNPGTTLTGEASQDVIMQDTPELSPASIPTETPASTPAQVSYHPPRPDSRTNARGRGRGRGGLTPGPGTATATAPSFKPKAIRRDQTERQRLADEERKKIEERNKAAQMAEGRGGHRGRGLSRGRAGRGRGDAMGKRIMSTLGKASGLFGELPKGWDDKNKKFGQDSLPFTVVGASGYEAPTGPGFSHTNRVNPVPHVAGGTSSAAGGSGTKGGDGGVGGPSNKVYIKEEQPDPVYPGFAEEGHRNRGIDIERINLVSDDEDEGFSTGKGKGRASDVRKKGLKPVRLLREEHKEREMIVNTEASAAPPAIEETDVEVVAAQEQVDDDDDDDENAMFCKEILRPTKTKSQFSAVWSDPEDEVKIKPEPGLDEAMDVDAIPSAEPPKGPLTEAELTKKEKSSPRVKARARRASGLRDKRPVHQTEEDKEEWSRHLHDVAVLANELGHIQTAPRRDIEDADGDMKMEIDEDLPDPVDKKEGRLYLFQFPPILPPLYNPNKIKEEKIEEDENEVTLVSKKPAPGMHGSTTAPIDISKPANPNDSALVGNIKTEPDDDAWKKQNDPTPSDIAPEEGFIGKLILRESGKVEMSWGGTSFELNRGAVNDFLTTGLLMDGLDEVAREGDMRPLAASSLGSIMGKFVVTPDWDKMF